jgi:hypothetical protein
MGATSISAPNRGIRFLPKGVAAARKCEYLAANVASNAAKFSAPPSA